MARKILIVSSDRAEKGLLDPIMEELKKRRDVVAEWFFPHIMHTVMLFPFIAFRSKLQFFNPDIVVIPTDRWEAVYAAAYAFHNGYIVVHFHAGNNPANHPDDINRRVISCFSHIMLCNMLEHKENLIKQGEEPWRIHVVGSTAFDGIIFDDSLTPKEPFDLVILHPNPLSLEKTEQDLRATLEAAKDSPKVIWIYPNHDRNFEVIECFLDNNDHQFIIDREDSVVLAHYRAITKYRNLPRNQYFSLLKNCTRAIGNSSSFFYEMPVLDSQNKLVHIGERNKGLIVPKTMIGGSKRIAELLATIPIDDKLRRKKLILR